MQAIIGTVSLDLPVPLVPVRVCPLTPPCNARALEVEPTTPVHTARLPLVLSAVAACSTICLRPVPIPNASEAAPAVAVLQTAIPAVPAHLQAITGTAIMDRPVPPLPVLVCPLTPPCNLSALQAEPTTPVHTPRLPPVLPAVAA